MQVGDKFGRLTVLTLLPPVQKKYKVVVKCECGVKKVIYKNALIKGSTKSCGCLKAEIWANHPWKKGRKYETKTTKEQTKAKAAETT